MSGGGTVVTFALNASEGEAKKRAFELLDALRLVNISNNLGDSKSLITHPATTTHRAMGPEGRAAVGITDGVVRLSVGLEDTADLLTDLEQALA
jgi:O-succinylhomoserine sulfhydrylase